MADSPLSTGTFKGPPNGEDDFVACLWAGYRHLFTDPDNARYTPDYETVMVKAGIPMDAIGQERTRLQDAMSQEFALAYITAWQVYLKSKEPYDAPKKEEKVATTERNDITATIAPTKAPRGKKQKVQAEAEKLTPSPF